MSTWKTTLKTLGGWYNQSMARRAAGQCIHPNTTNAPSSRLSAGLLTFCHLCDRPIWSLIVLTRPLRGFAVVQQCEQRPNIHPVVGRDQIQGQGFGGRRRVSWIPAAKRRFLSGPALVFPGLQYPDLSPHKENKHPSSSSGCRAPWRGPTQAGRPRNHGPGRSP